MGRESDLLLKAIPLFLAACCAVVLVAAPSPVQLKLAAPIFSAANVKEEVARFASDHFSQHLALQGLQVITSSEISALVGLERQKELLGCTEAAQSCLAELSNALGADAVVVGSLGRFGEAIVVNVKVVASGTGRQLAVYSGKAKSESELPEELAEAARQVGSQLLVRDSGQSTPITRRGWALIPAGLGVVAIAVGAGFLGVSGTSRAHTTSAATLNDAIGFNRAAESQATTGLLVGGIGLAAGVAAAVMFFTRSDAPPVAIGLTPGGAAVFLNGSFE